MAQAHREVIVDIDVVVYYDNSGDCYLGDDVGLPLNYHCRIVGYVVVYCLHTFVFRPAHLDCSWSADSRSIVVRGFYIGCSYDSHPPLDRHSPNIDHRLGYSGLRSNKAHPIEISRWGSICRSGPEGRFKRMYSDWSTVCARQWQIGQ